MWKQYLHAISCQAPKKQLPPRLTNLISLYVKWKTYFALKSPSCTNYVCTGMRMVDCTSGLNLTFHDSIHWKRTISMGAIWSCPEEDRYSQLPVDLTKLYLWRNLFLLKSCTNYLCTWMMVAFTAYQVVYAWLSITNCVKEQL